MWLVFALLDCCFSSDRTLQEPLPELTAAELGREVEQEAAVFAQAVNVDKLLTMLRTIDSSGENLADNEEIQVRESWNVPCIVTLNRLGRSYIVLACLFGRRSSSSLTNTARNEVRSSDFLWKDILRASFSRSRVDERKLREGTGHLRSDDGRQSCKTHWEYVHSQSVQSATYIQVVYEVAPRPDYGHGQAPYLRQEYGHQPPYGYPAATPGFDQQPPQQQSPYGYAAPTGYPESSYPQQHADPGYGQGYSPGTIQPYGGAIPHPARSPYPQQQPQPQHQPQVQTQPQPQTQPQHQPQLQPQLQPQPQPQPQSQPQPQPQPQPQAHQQQQYHTPAAEVTQAAQPQGQSQPGTEESGPPYVYDPHTTYADPNVQAWAQYYAQGGKDSAGAVYFFSVPGVTGGPPDEAPPQSSVHPEQGGQPQGLSPTQTTSQPQATSQPGDSAQSSYFPPGSTASQPQGPYGYHADSPGTAQLPAAQTGAGAPYSYPSAHPASQSSQGLGPTYGGGPGSGSGHGHASSPVYGQVSPYDYGVGGLQHQFSEMGVGSGAGVQQHAYAVTGGAPS